MNSSSLLPGTGEVIGVDQSTAESGGATAAAPVTEKGNAFTFSFNPRFMLGIFTIVNLFTYFDRGAIGVVLNTIESPDVYDLSNFQGGLLGGSYMIGFVIASPVFAHLAKLYHPLKMMSGGLFVWILATLGTGLSGEFYSLLIARMVTGVGEASFLCLAPPFINKFAPENKKSVCLCVRVWPVCFD
jgi:MFS family permease